MVGVQVELLAGLTYSIGTTPEPVPYASSSIEWDDVSAGGLRLRPLLPAGTETLGQCSASKVYYGANTGETNSNAQFTPFYGDTFSYIIPTTPDHLEVQIHCIWLTFASTFSATEARVDTNQSYGEAAGLPEPGVGLSGITLDNSADASPGSGYDGIESVREVSRDDAVSPLGGIVAAAQEPTTAVDTTVDPAENGAAMLGGTIEITTRICVVPPAARQSRPDQAAPAPTISAPGGRPDKPRDERIDGAGAAPQLFLTGLPENDLAA